jgi:hypothetical protein
MRHTTAHPKSTVKIELQRPNALPRSVHEYSSVSEFLSSCKSNFTAKGYDPESLKALLGEYVKAIDTLTINDENRLRKKVIILEQKQAESETLAANYEFEMRSVGADNPDQEEIYLYVRIIAFKNL